LNNGKFEVVRASSWSEAMTMEFLQAAFDWAEYRDVPIAAFRDQLRDWHVRLTFRDSQGWFHGTCRAAPLEPRTADGYADAVFAMLNTASAQIREDRIRTFNALPMKVGASRVGRLNVISREPGDLRRRAVHLFEPRLPGNRGDACRAGGTM
jgi:hypothetical protein